MGSDSAVAVDFAAAVAVETVAGIPEQLFGY
jgi:hypothetical protein